MVDQAAGKRMRGDSILQAKRNLPEPIQLSTAFPFRGGKQARAPCSPFLLSTMRPCICPSCSQFQLASGLRSRCVDIVSPAWKHHRLPRPLLSPRIDLEQRHFTVSQSITPDRRQMLSPSSISMSIFIAVSACMMVVSSSAESCPSCESPEAAPTKKP